ncbi:MAG: lipopolysaccharide biosynthesis protein [Spirochaetia bacterium]|nr:lipopolysaccharide biosynthesis protein [Spirochaetia bacterium]
MSDNINKAKIISSLIWKLFERIGKKGITFVISIILARLLLPRDFGIVVLARVFIDIVITFIENGFSVALIQKQDADELDFSSVFYFGLGIAGLCYAVLWFLAPGISRFYGIPEIQSVLRVLSVIIFIGTVNSIQDAILSKNMQFKKSFKIVISSVLISALIGIWMAYHGFGVWALVWQKIVSYIVSCAIMFWLIKWRPKLMFSFTRIKKLFSFGVNTFFASVLNFAYNDLCSLVIGKTFSSADLGIYSKGMTFPQFIVSNLDGSIQSVMFPAFAAYQDNRERLKEMVRRSIVTSCFFVVPAMVGLAIVARPLVLLLLTEKWLPCVFFLQWACVKFAFWPIQTANMQVLKAMGYGGTLLKFETIKKIICVAGFCVAAFWFRSLKAIVILDALATLISVIISTLPNSRYINYSIHQQLMDVFPSVVLSAVMGLCIVGMRFFGLGSVLTMVLQTAVGMLVYFGLAFLFRLESLGYLLRIIRRQ